jgi:hypothetical protein
MTLDKPTMLAPEQIPKPKAHREVERVCARAKRTEDADGGDYLQFHSIIPSLREA